MTGSNLLLLSSHLVQILCCIPGVEIVVFKEGPHLSCLAVYEGEYKVKVQYDGQVELSEAVQIVKFNVFIASQGKSKNKRVTASYRVSFNKKIDFQ